MKVNDPDAIQIMKDYMANGRFSRGITQVHADASLVFIGNLNQPVETLVQNTATDLFQPLPKEFDLASHRPPALLPAWLGGSEELKGHPDHALWLRDRLSG